MAFLLLGYVPADQPVPPDLAAHHRLGVGNIQAVLSEVDPADAESDIALLTWAGTQNEVLSAFAAQGDVVPVPLGSVFSDRQAVAGHIATHRADIETAFARLRGLCEYMLYLSTTRAQTDPGPDPINTDGRAYLVSRQDRRNRRNTDRQDRTACRERLWHIVQHQAELTVGLSKSQTHDAGGLSMLVPRTQTDSLIAQLVAEAPRLDAAGLSARLVGPCPAFSFMQQTNPDMCADG